MDDVSSHEGKSLQEVRICTLLHSLLNVADLLGKYCVVRYVVPVY